MAALLQLLDGLGQVGGGVEEWDGGGVGLAGLGGMWRCGRRCDTETK